MSVGRETHRYMERDDIYEALERISVLKTRVTQTP